MDRDKCCTAIKVGNRWKAGYITFAKMDGSVGINDCTSPFNGLRFKTRSAAENFIASKALIVFRSYGNKLSPVQAMAWLGGNNDH